MDIPQGITDLTRLDSTTDLDERFRILTAATEAVPALQRAIAAERAKVVQTMKGEPGATWETVGARIGLHFARASQIAKGITGGGKKRPATD